MAQPEEAGAAEYVDLSVRQTDNEAAKCEMCFLSVYGSGVYETSSQSGSLIADTDMGFGSLFVIFHVNQPRVVFSVILQPDHHRNGIYLVTALPDYENLSHDVQSGRVGWCRLKG